MSLSEGTKLGTFEITGQIGGGGMGEVYRATDSKLGRQVAIKTLPGELADDKDRLARFIAELTTNGLAESDSAAIVDKALDAVATCIFEALEAQAKSALGKLGR